MVGQVGDLIPSSVVPSNWNTPGTMVIVGGNRMVPNGPNLSRTDFNDTVATVYHCQLVPRGHELLDLHPLQFGLPA